MGISKKFVFKTKRKKIGRPKKTTAVSAPEKELLSQKKKLPNKLILPYSNSIRKKMSRLVKATKGSEREKVPLNRKKILPDKLKLPYSKNFSPSDVRLFLGLFYQPKRGKRKNQECYELDVFAEKLHPVHRINKVYREISSAIYCLADGRTSEEDKPGPLKKSHIRTICILLTLDGLFKEFYRLWEKSPDHGYDWEIKKPLIDNLYNESFEISFWGENKKETWSLSYPLLLVQAARFSQWELENQDYCFEFFTAKRARKYLQDKFDGWFEKDKWDDEDKAQLNRVLNTFTRLIRWHTLEGQFRRRTSEFGLEELQRVNVLFDSKPQNCLTDIEKKLLHIITYADTAFREGGTKFEEDVYHIITKAAGSDEHSKELILGKLKLIERSYLGKELKDKLLSGAWSGARTWKTDPEEDLENIIWSYSKPPGAEKEYFLFRKEIKEIIKKANTQKPDELEYKENLYHIIFPQKQRNIGIFNKIFENTHKNNIANQLKVSWLPDPLRLEGLPHERIVLATFYPNYIASKNYDLCKDFKGHEKSPVKFLRCIFKDILNDFNSRIPLPMIKRTTDLLEYYYLIQTALPGMPPDTNAVFPVRIIFDHGASQIDVWLPANVLESSEAEINENLTVAGLLVRYLNNIVFNYGMTRQFSHVDLDFSAFSSSMPGYPRNWRERMNDPRNRYNDSTDMLGLNVFDRYLTDVGIDKMEKTFSRQKYFNAIERRKMINLHSFDRPAEKLRLENKYILGIDIGGTGIKLKFFEIQQDINLREGCFLLSEQPSVKNRNQSAKYAIAPTYKIKENLLRELSLQDDPHNLIKLIESLAGTNYKSAEDFIDKIKCKINEKFQTAGSDESRNRSLNNNLTGRIEQLNKTDVFPHTHYYLVPVQYKDKYLEFSITTLPNEKANKEGDQAKFESAESFADYIVETLWGRLEVLDNQNSVSDTNEAISRSCEQIFKNIICIGFCWPGPIKQNHIASTSGILNNFMGFKSSILENEYHKIANLDIAGAVKEAFLKKRKSLTKQQDDNESLKIASDRLTVALANDGDVEAAGLAFGQVNSLDNTSGSNEEIKAVEEKLENKVVLKKLFEEYSIIIIKAGTGTAGSVLSKGDLLGLNEFGKLIVNLGASNIANENKEKDHRWPVGLANHYFSMKTFQQIMKTAGVPENLKNEVTGRDIALILKIEDKHNLNSLENIRRFGVLELESIAQPHIEWNDLIEGDEIKNDITVEYGKDEAFRIVTRTNQSNINSHTLWNLTNQPLMKQLHLPADKPLRLVNSYQNQGGRFGSSKSDHKLEKADKEDLLTKLGRNRIARMNFEAVTKNSQLISEGIGEVGRSLGDIIALLFDIYEPKAVFIAGGVMNSEEISRACIDGLEDVLKKYLYDTFHSDDNLLKYIQKYDNIGELDKLRSYKLIIKKSEKNHALLGAAILGFDHYIQKQKIKELQALVKELAQEKEGKISTYEGIRFLKDSEALRFMKTNAGQLNITIDDSGEFFKL